MVDKRGLLADEAGAASSPSRGYQAIPPQVRRPVCIVCVGGWVNSIRALW